MEKLGRLLAGVEGPELAKVRLSDSILLPRLEREGEVDPVSSLVNCAILSKLVFNCSIVQKDFAASFAAGVPSGMP